MSPIYEGRLTAVEHEATIQAPAGAVWGWHERPGALERLTPPWERIEILSQEGGIADGASVRLRVKAGPFWLRWAARHRDGIPGVQFVDELESGPFARWVHLHRIDPIGPGTSRIYERVEFAPSLAALGAVAIPIVRRRIERMLAYRHAVLAEDLAAHRRAPGQPLHIAVTGSSGLIGRALVPLLTTGGHRVTRIVRRRPGAGEVRWDPAGGSIDAAALEGVDAVVHLAGEGIASGLWTAARKRRIMASRVEGTRLLAGALAGLRSKPDVLVSVAGSNIYGNRGDERLEDGAAPGQGFLADVVRGWESAADPARDAGIRVVHPRFGAVLTPAGGALAAMLPIFRVGAGGRVGSGRQWMSVVSIDDAIGIIHHAITTPSVSGPCNACIPEPVTNAEFTRTLGRVLHRPARLVAPAPLLRAALGQLADEALLFSMRTEPTALLAAGYRFRHPTLERALSHVLGRAAR